MKSLKQTCGEYVAECNINISGPIVVDPTSNLFMVGSTKYDLSEISSLSIYFEGGAILAVNFRDA